jgi:magnesium-transporting ATPase (P-type)
VGIVTYTGKDTKIMKNSVIGPVKKSSLEVKYGWQVVLIFALMIIVSFTASTYNLIVTNGDNLQYLNTQESEVSKVAVFF